MLCDEQSEPGGWLLSTDEMVDGMPAAQWSELALARLSALPEVTVLPRTTAFGYHDHNFVTLVERRADHLPVGEAPAFRERLWRVRARQVVLATGAHERPLVFANNDLPGVMLASAVSSYARRYAVLPGRNVVVFTNNDAGCDAALALRGAGAAVTIVDARPQPTGSLSQRAHAAGIEVLAGFVVTEARGGKRVRGVIVQAIDLPATTAWRAPHRRLRPARRVGRLQPGDPSTLPGRVQAEMGRRARRLSAGRTGAGGAFGRGVPRAAERCANARWTGSPPAARPPPRRASRWRPSRSGHCRGRCRRHSRAVAGAAPARGEPCAASSSSTCRTT